MSAAIPKTDPPPAAPLSNPVAEAAIIAGLMNCGDPAVIGRYALDNRLDADCFTQTAYRVAYTAILDLAAAGQPVDMPILAGHLDAEALATVDSACREHVSAANFTHYARILAGCKQRRAEAAARDRLAQAVASGAPPHELDAIVESIRLAGKAPSDQKIRFVDVGDLCDAPPKEDWLIKGYLTLDSLTEIFGDPGCGKSFLAIDIAGHVATGRAWRGRKVRPGFVLYIAGEGKNGLSKRFKAWFERHNEPFRNIKICTTPIALTEKENIADLVDDISRELPEPPALIIVDTLNRNFGAGNENATEDMTKAVAGMDAIRIPTGAAVVTIHHSGIADKTRGRGNSALKGATDFEYGVELCGGTVQIRCTKTKDSEPPPPIAWTLQKQFLPWCDDEGTPIDSAVLEPCDLPEPPPAPDTARMGAKQNKALDLLRGLYRNHSANLVQAGTDPGTARVTKADWYVAMKAAGFTRNRCTDAKAELVRRGLVREQDLFVYLTDAEPVPEYRTGTNHGTPQSTEVPEYPTSCGTSLVPDFVPDFVPEAYRNVPDTQNGDVPYRTGVPIGTRYSGTPQRTGSHERDETPKHKGNGSGHAGDNPDILADIPIASPPESQGIAKACAAKAPDMPPKPLSPLDSDIIEYLSRVATTATDDEVHRQVNRGQQGRTLAMTRIALHKLVRAGLVDKINGQYRLAGARP